MNRDEMLQQGLALHQSGDIAGAIDLYRRVLFAHPHDADALNLLGAAELQAGRPGQAVRRLRQAVAERREAGFYGNLAMAQIALGAFAEARLTLQQAIEIDNNYIEGWHNLADLSVHTEDQEAAALSFSALVRLSGGKDGEALGRLGVALAVMCEWAELRKVHEALKAVPDWRVSGGVPVAPFSLLIHEMAPEEFRRRAEWKSAWISERIGQHHAPFAHAARPRREKLRVGYFSDDLRDHPVGYLAIAALEAHDIKRYDIAAYRWGPPDQSPTGQRAAAAMRVVDLEGLDPVAAAEKIRGDGIDILVDLKGDAPNARPEVLALRPAPVQVNYLGYPGTSGAAFIDYILADPFVVPPGAESGMSETVARLPGCYMPGDPNRPRPATRPGRAQYGLPEEGVVFCSFNASFKLGETLFAGWLDPLERHPGSVLWILDSHHRAVANLRRATEARGIDLTRLIFAPLVSHEQHMRRLAVADLALDTYPYGGHTTTSDALWCGLPVVTRAGELFASRVAGSLLTHLGFPELVATDEAGYLAIADRFAGDPAALADLRTRIDAARAGAALFDPVRHVRGLEAAYDRMWEHQARGEAPESFSLS